MPGLSETGGPKVAQLSENLNKQKMREQHLCGNVIQRREMRNVNDQQKTNHLDDGTLNTNPEVAQALQRVLPGVNLHLDQACCVSLPWSVTCSHNMR